MKEALAGIFLIWFAVGFVAGAMVTIDYRTDTRWDSAAKTAVDISRSGCVYKSAAAFINPGYIAACELFRRRFEVEGFKGKP